MSLSLTSTRRTNNDIIDMVEINPNDEIIDMVEIEPKENNENVTTAVQNFNSDLSSEESTSSPSAQCPRCQLGCSCSKKIHGHIILL